ncbi:MAG: ribonuclease E/G, partial [Gaiella sp.]
MPWFRWLKKATTEGTAVEAAPPPVAPPDAPLPARETETNPDPSATAEEAAAEAERRKRRRGSRGGRGRKKPGAADAESATAESTADDDAATPGATRAPKEKEQGERKEPQRRRSGTGTGSGRRKQPPRRAPLPAAKRELVIAVDVGEQRVAILEDDKVAEVYLERPERRSIAGNIYLGVVDNVLPGMEAAFVEIGLEKNGFLYVDEIVVPELEGKRHGKKIQDLISRGEKILVQAVKDPMKTKGARLTTEISLPGRFLVYVPNGEGLGVSRRLEEGERQRLKE